MVWLLHDAKPFFVFYTAGGKAFYNGKICGEKEKCWPELDRLEICVCPGNFYQGYAIADWFSTALKSLQIEGFGSSFLVDVIVNPA
ncbi:hypothetical protein [Heyndrickxia coagulans]|uniref:hypothetical protein n=1 Tax=Heyndrickxia coagulans TaxID=1398 RepID=UPI0012BCF2FE|nr:hypothetical protein [Heyndrickxia coagulans]